MIKLKMGEQDIFVYLEGFTNENDIIKITHFVESDNNFKVTQILSKASYIVYEMDPEKGIYSLPRRRKQIAIDNMKSCLQRKYLKNL